MISFLQKPPFILHPSVLILALMLDLSIGDPRWLPHPVRIIGSAISRAERMLRGRLSTPSREKAGGVALVLLIVVPAFVVSFLLCEAAGRLSGTVPRLLALAALVYLTSTTIAVRELAGSARLVTESVRRKDLAEARQRLGMIVGRDTHSLSEKDVLRATMETLAENLSDGVIAPVFYLAAGGLPLAIVYKAVNTLDSMVGYKNARYLHFGRAAARLDDLANYIPARLTGMLIVAASSVVALFKDMHGLFTVVCRSSLFTMLRDGRNHTSPNSGIPEAAMAGALGVRMGGPSTYGGVLVEKPRIGDSRIAEDTAGYLTAAGHAIIIVRVASLLGAALAALFLSLRSA